MDNERYIVELTFPGVDEGWATARLGDVVSFKVTNSFSRDNLNYDIGSIRNIHYGDIHMKFQALFDITKENVPFINPDIEIHKIKEESYCQVGDLILADASEDLADVGKNIEIVNLNNEKLVSGLHTIHARPAKGLFPKGFIGYLFQSSFIRKQIQKESQGTKVMSISPTRLQNLIIHYPLSIIHSTKIASYLSSLDEVIAAHSQKLDILKDHKKGLMQNLFPQEDENVPKYRFKEFEKDGEWVEKSFEQLFDIGNGRDYKHLEKGEIPVYGSGGYMLSVDDFLYNGESVCIGRKGTIDKPMFLNGKFWTVDTLFYTHSFKDCLPKYIFYVFENINWRTHNEAGGVPSLSKTNIYKIKVLVPPSIIEQQKIASCLSSLDALITAQAERIEHLKLHKKGLMQGLFPAVSDR